MSDENLMWVTLTVIIIVSTTVAFFTENFLDRALPLKYALFKIIFAGILPTLLIILFLMAWDYFDYLQYLNGPQEGHMGAVVFLLYGFPYVLLNFLCNLCAAVYSRRQHK
jgi:hypothetical protein